MNNTTQRHPTAAPSADRRARPRAACPGTATAGTHLHRVVPICNANACHQGHRTCPTPLACEVPEEAPGTPMEYTGLVLGVLGVVVLLGLALISCASA